MNSNGIAQQSSRLLSLDIFRGIAIAGMIMVNNPGSWSYVYRPLRHAQCSLPLRDARITVERSHTALECFEKISNETIDRTDNVNS